jgi:hypothetical protein
MPELGLPEKSYGYVDSAADWYAPTEEHPYNTVEYHETLVPGEPEHFIGFTEDLGGYGDTHRFPRRDGCRRRAIEVDDDFVAYPAVFFRDPGGTALEICARRPKS